MKFKDFQAPVLFSSTFKALNLGLKNSRMRGNPVIIIKSKLLCVVISEFV